MSDQPTLMFITRPDRGYVAEAWCFEGPDALILIRKAGAVVRKILYPAYRIWNVGAHFSEYVDELERAE